MKQAGVIILVICGFIFSTGNAHSETEARIRRASDSEVAKILARIRKIEDQCASYKTSMAVGRISFWTKIFPHVAEINYSVHKLCVEKTYDMGFKARPFFPVWKDDNCEERYRVGEEFFFLISSLVESEIVRSLELSCIQSRAQFQLINIDLKSVIIRSSDLYRVELQGVDIRGGFDIHSSNIDYFYIKESRIQRRIVFSRSYTKEFFIKGSISGALLVNDYYFSKLYPDRWSRIEKLQIFDSRFENIKIQDTEFDYVEFYYITARDFYSAARTNKRFYLTLSYIENSLVFDEPQAGDKIKLWSNAAILDLSGTSARIFDVPVRGLENEKEEWTLVNFAGFQFKEISRATNANKKEHLILFSSIFDESVPKISEWLDRSLNVFPHGRGSEMYFRIAKYFDRTGRGPAATSFRILAKRNEWWVKDKAVFFVGYIVGYGYYSINLLYGAIFLILLGTIIKNRSNRRLREPSSILRDVAYSVDQLIPGSQISRSWPALENFSRGARAYFYLHRIVGVLIVLLLTVSLVGVF